MRGHEPGCTPSEEVARSQVILPTTVWIEAARLRIADAADKAEVYRQHGRANAATPSWTALRPVLHRGS
jgi:hypothetical protein